MWIFFLQSLADIFALWLADKYIKEVEFSGPFFYLPKNLSDFHNFFSSLVFLGILLAFLNYFIKPILKKITLPLRIITLNLFSFIIAMFLVWLVDVSFPELIIKGIKALFLTTILVWSLELIVGSGTPVKNK